jgi:flagellar motor protein MotB
MSIFTKHFHSRRNVDEDNPYWLSFSDIMSGLLVVFILASLYLMLELQEKKDLIDESVIELMEANKVRSEILHEIKEDLLDKGVEVDVVDNETVLRIPSDQLHFMSGLFEIPKSKLSIVKMIGESLHESIMKPERIKYIDTIFIEGHTDSDPIPGGNWRLSSRRAITVWDNWRKAPEFGQQLVSIRNRKGDSIFSVSGYAATRRLNENETNDKERRENRRIDIRFTMKQPDYKSILYLQKKAQ